MADRIYIRTGDMPTGSLKKGKNKVDDVVSTLLPLTHQRGNPLDSIYYVMNGEYHRLFSNGAATLVANCCAEMQNLQLQIETYLAILNSGPSEFEQIDRAAKNSLTTWADRTSHAIGGAFSPITNFIGGTFSYLFLPKGLTGFFMTLHGSSGQKQKSEQESTKQDSSERPLPGWAPGASVITIHPQREVHEGDVCVRPEDWSAENKKTESSSDEQHLEEIREMFNGGKKVVDVRTEYGTGNKRVYKDQLDKNGKRKLSTYFEITGGCTWYAAARYEQVNGEGSLVFKEYAGNASNWDNAIHRDYFDVIDINEDTVIQPNALAISDRASKGTSANHVCYIEAVDGEYVYYSEGAAKKKAESIEAYNTRVDSDFGRIKRMSIDDFKVAYEHIIIAK